VLGRTDETSPIYVRTLSGLAEALEWELLYDAAIGEFIALKDTWPIGRTTKGSSSNRVPQPFPQPLRVLAIMSAAGAGQSAVGEWRALQDAVEAGAAGGLDVRLHVLTGEPALVDAVTAAGGSVDLLPGRVDLVVRQIREQDPHLLHIFGHGGNAAGVSFIELATKADHLAGSERGSLTLTADDLKSALAEAGTWLLLLSSCSGAQGSAESRSLARRVVEDARIPAAIGMAAPITPKDAETFTATFYTALLDNIREVLAAPGAAGIDWASLLCQPRRVLRGVKDPKMNREWSLPVVYALDPPFTPVFESREAADAFQLTPPDRVKLTTVAEFLKTLGDADEALKQDVRKRLLAGIPEALWPDLSGNFPT
jgi:hypothetical protein